MEFLPAGGAESQVVGDLVGLVQVELAQHVGAEQPAFPVDRLVCHVGWWVRPRGRARRGGRAAAAGR